MPGGDPPAEDVGRLMKELRHGLLRAAQDYGFEAEYLDAQEARRLEPQKEEEWSARCWMGLI